MADPWSDNFFAFVVLLICIGITLVSRWMADRRKAQLSPEAKEEVGKFRKLFAHTARLQDVEQFQTSRSLRRAYRKNWTEKILASRSYAEAREVIRNLIMTNTAFLSAVLISFGILTSGFTILMESGEPDVQYKMLSISALLLYALFMLISESRVLNYVPILLWVDEEIMERIQGMSKTDYIARLMNDAFDHFSSSLRAIFYAVACIFWFFSVPVFIVTVIMLTAIIVASDLDKTVRITIF